MEGRQLCVAKTIWPDHEVLGYGCFKEGHGTPWLELEYSGMRSPFSKEYVAVDSELRPIPDRFRYWIRDGDVYEREIEWAEIGSLAEGDRLFMRWSPEGKGTLSYWWPVRVVRVSQRCRVRWERCSCPGMLQFEEEDVPIRLLARAICRNE